MQLVHIHPYLKTYQHRGEIYPLDLAIYYVLYNKTPIKCHNSMINVYGMKMVLIDLNLKFEQQLITVNHLVLTNNFVSELMSRLHCVHLYH